jgi:diaminopimelate epimerase
MPLAYLKMQGAGNDIVVIDQRRDGRPPPSPARLRALADTASGPGFDQLMWVGPAAEPSMDASYRVFNADGSEVEQCGNGIRCVAWLLARDSGQRTTFRLEGAAGSVEARILADGRVTVNMGAPAFEPALVPFTADGAAAQYAIDVDGETITAAVLSMGNPHCIIEVADVATADVTTLGARLENHARFPSRTNVGFMHVLDRGTIDLRVFERGVGETLACGTGACAAVVAGQRLGKLDERVSVRLPGGQLVVSWAGNCAPVWLTGEVRLIEEGIVDP